jgi:OmpA-OmpF porin, OOP family
MQNSGIESSGGYINEFEGALHLRALNDDHLFNPFLTAGIGIGNYGKKAWVPAAGRAKNRRVELKLHYD